MFGNVRNRETLKKNTRISIDLRTWISIDFLVLFSIKATRSEEKNVFEIVVFRSIS